MTFDVILSSQAVPAHSDKSDVGSFQFLVESDRNSFSLTLSEEESDWESDYSASGVAATRECRDLRNSQVAASPQCSLDLFDGYIENQVAVESESFSNHRPSSPQVKESETVTTPSMKCQTAFSQDLEVSGELEPSLSFSEQAECANSTDLGRQDFSEVVCSIRNSGKSLSNLDIDASVTTVYNLVACIILCYPVREIWCKSRSCWQTMSAILLGDFSAKHLKLMLWNKHCHYSLSQRTGNLVYIDLAQVKRVRGERILGLKPNSNIIPLVSLSLATEAIFIGVETSERSLASSIESNRCWFRTEYRAMCTSAFQKTMTQTTDATLLRLKDLSCGNVVHVNVRIASTLFNVKDKNAPAVVCVYNEEEPRVYCNLYLNGSSRAWIGMFKKYRHHLWEIRFVACCLSAASDRPELHTTVFSSAECQPPENTIFERRQKTPFLRSHQELLDAAASGGFDSSLVRLYRVRINSIAIESSASRASIKKSSSRSALLFWLDIINRSCTERLTFTFKCSFESSARTFNIVGLYSGLLDIVGVSCLKTLHSQTAETLMKKIEEALSSLFSIVVVLKSRRDRRNLLNSVKLKFDSAVRL